MIESQADRAIEILVSYFLNEFSHLDVDSKFFGEFAPQTLLKSLRRLTFAARKFPQATHMRLFVALGDEQFSGPEDQAGGNLHDRRAHGS